MNMTKKAAAAACVAFMAGCAQAPPTRQEWVCGKEVAMIPDGQEECSASVAADGCAVYDGKTWTVRYAADDAFALAHEREHVCGMSHKEPWARLPQDLNCSQVTQSGSTAWKVGQTMCRKRSGPVYAESNPWVVDQTRRQQEASHATDPMAKPLGDDRPKAATGVAEGKP